MDNEVDFVCDLIFSDPLDHRGPMDLDSENMPAEPVELFLAKCAAEFSMAKNGRSAVDADPTWLEPIGAAPGIHLSAAFLERSEARFARVAATIHEFFGEHSEQAEEAIRLAKGIRDAEREVVLAAQ